tara:strand:- start:3669 stop:4010 length:342 start_codon:yes stop_codon:yes gene_type:complete
MREKDISDTDLIISYLCLTPIFDVGNIKVYKLIGIGNVTTSLFKFHSEWQWLTILIDKIVKDGYEVDIEESYTLIRGYKKRIYYPIKIERTQIRATYKAVMELLRYINKKPDE